MTKKQLKKEEMIKLFEDVNSTILTKKTAEMRKSAEKVTIEDLLKAHDVKLQLPDQLKATLKPALEADLNGDPASLKGACAACTGCALCILCEEINFGAGAVGIVGTVDIS